MPKFTIQINVTKAQEGVYLSDLTASLLDDLCYDVAPDFSVDYQQIKDLKSFKQIATAARRVAKTLLEQIYADTIKDMEKGNADESFETTVNDRVFDWEALDGAEAFMADLRELLVKKKDFLKLTESTKEERDERARRELLRLAEEVGATVTFQEGTE